ncbi:NUDIX domain-containing protein [Haloechinothrix sp. LS1_15]|uniref:NUDIX hydrolase n=1 Tax=Haloechinothrix sp. LS1_15 TaxID=2652248 RepID=UPI0029469576|nr:NUDIX domain-containing protein [Haloechinothrix sp. LS1_15]MDV6013879.1 NUDIX domain-containing protein [Haloechinothrix sp. LS1_15]
MMHDAIIRCVGGVVYDDTGRILLIKRATDPGEGLWSVPGGRVHPGESDAKALVRELREETGLDVCPGALLGTVTRGQFEIVDYVCRRTGGLLRAGDDAADARWISAAEYRRMDRDGLLVDGLTDALRSWDALPRG